MPHNGDAGLIHEETTGTLFSSNLFTQTGPADPTTESDIVAPAIAVAERLPFMPPTPIAAPTLRRLAALKLTTLMRNRRNFPTGLELAPVISAKTTNANDLWRFDPEGISPEKKIQVVLTFLE